jgi:hypothetical protein
MTRAAGRTIAAVQTKAPIAISRSSGGADREAVEDRRREDEPGEDDAEDEEDGAAQAPEEDTDDGDRARRPRREAITCMRRASLAGAWGHHHIG